MLFKRSKQQPQDVSVANNNEKLIELYVNEYNIVTGKVTSLSLKFSSGSYILPISIIAGILALMSDAFVIAVFNISSPIFITLYFYNHVRYMALQFKLSGYARHLEERINELAGCYIYQWENKLARHSKQNFFEGGFIAIIYLLIYALLYSFAYKSLIKLNDLISYNLLYTIISLYYISFMSLIFFLQFFVNQHNLIYELANDTPQSSVKIQTKTAKSVTSKKESKTSFWIAKALSKGSRKLMLISLIAIACLLPVSALGCVYFSAMRENPNCNSSYDCIIVLGHKTNDNKPSKELKARLDACINIYNNNIETISQIIVSGGNGNIDSNVLPESEVMKAYLVQNNVPESIIILESESKNTIDNFQAIKEMNNFNALNTLVITSDYHVFRARMISEGLGQNFSFYGAAAQGGLLLHCLTECYWSWLNYIMIYL